jgi:hypothetical protein
MPLTFDWIRRLSRSDTALLYPVVALQAAVLVLSLNGIDLGFWPKTTLARLYQHPAVNAALALVIAAGLIKLGLTSAEARSANAVAFAGFLWGIGAACAFAFDVGVFVAYLFAGGNLYRVNAPAAAFVARADKNLEKGNKPLEPTR